MHAEGHPIFAPAYKANIPPNVLALTVERTGPLQEDPLLTNPVVRVHLVDPATGAYIASMDDPAINMDPHTQAQVRAMVLISHS